MHISTLLDGGCTAVIRISVSESESHISILAFYLSALSAGCRLVLVMVPYLENKNCLCVQTRYVTQSN